MFFNLSGFCGTYGVTKIIYFDHFFDLGADPKKPLFRRKRKMISIFDIKLGHFIEMHSFHML